MGRSSSILLALLGFLASTNATLFALNDTSVGHVFRLVTLDPATGEKTAVSKTATIPFIPWTTSVDHDNAILYFVGQKVMFVGNLTLVGVSLTSGAVVSTTPIPEPVGQTALLASSVAFAADFDLVILSFTTLDKSHVMGTINPKTGEWKVLVNLNAATVGEVGGAGDGVYVPLSGGEYIWQLSVSKVITQFAFNFKTGELRNATSAQFTDFVYNPKDSMLWGHGVKIGPPINGTRYFIRTLEKMDPTTLAVSQVAVLTSLSCDTGSFSTLDVEKQIMYWPTMLSKDDTTHPPPIYLAQVSLVTASIVSISDVLCPTYDSSLATNTTCIATLNFA